VPARLVIVSVADQRLLLVEGDTIERELPVSTAARGVGSADGSLQTPPGVHTIHAVIGAGEPRGAVFESREPTGRVWNGEPEEDDLILTRVLVLDGCEEGVNRGPGVDSRQRFIYIHGTNHEDALGTPASHGCVRVSNLDAVRLADAVAEGDVVVVV